MIGISVSPLFSRKLRACRRSDEKFKNEKTKKCIVHGRLTADADRAISRDPPPRINTKLSAAILTQDSITRPNYPIRPGDRRRW